MAASTIWSGVRKSGWPMPRLIMSLPWAARAVARASTAKAFSSPIRSKFATVFIGLPALFRIAHIRPPAGGCQPAKWAGFLIGTPGKFIDSPADGGDTAYQDPEVARDRVGTSLEHTFARPVPTHCEALVGKPPYAKPQT